MDFKIPGLPHSTVKQLHGASFRNLIQKIDNYPNRHVLQRDSTTKSIIQSLQLRINRHDSWSCERGIVRTTWYGTLSTVQSMFIILGRRHRLLHVRALLARWNGGEPEIRQVHHGSPLDSELLHQEKGDPTGTVTGRSRWITSTSPRIRSRRNARREFLGYPRPAHPRREIPQEYEICREMDKLANEDHTHRITEEEIRVYRNNWWIRSNIVSSDTMPVRHRADFKTSLNNLATAQEPGGYSSTQPKMVAKLFLVLVELARFLVAFFIWASPRRWTQHWLIGETWSNYSRYDSQN